MFACGTGSYQPVCAFIQLGARGKVRDTLAGHIPIAEGPRHPQHVPVLLLSDWGWEREPAEGGRPAWCSP